MLKEPVLPVPALAELTKSGICGIVFHSPRISFLNSASGSMSLLFPMEKRLRQQEITKEVEGRDPLAVHNCDLIQI